MKPLPELSDDEFAALARRAVASRDAPDPWLQRVHDAWAEAQRPPAALPGFGDLAKLALQAATRRLAATLSFDSWAAAPLASGLRGLRGDTRQLIFSVEGRDIDLRLSAAAGSYTLAGQVLGPDESGSVELRLVPAHGPAAAAARSVPLDSLGEFHLDGVAPGRYVLTLTLGGEQVLLPAIDVGPVAA